MLAVPRNEFPEFPAALSFIMMLGPDQALEVLRTRADAVGRALAVLDKELGGELDFLPRVTRLETEYLRAVTAAELGLARERHRANSSRAR